jgi:hypothetical protein
VDDVDPFGAAVFGQARGYGREVPQGEPSEVWSVGSTDIAAVQVYMGGVDAAVFEVG